MLERINPEDIFGEARITREIFASGGLDGLFDAIAKHCRGQEFQAYNRLVSRLLVIAQDPEFEPFEYGFWSEIGAHIEGPGLYLNSIGEVGVVIVLSGAALVIVDMQELDQNLALSEATVRRLKQAAKGLLAELDGLGLKGADHEF